MCYDPAGEERFIRTTFCPNGHRLLGHRVGSYTGTCPAPAKHVLPHRQMYPGEPCMVDRYDCVCSGGEFKCTLYFDMYHPETMQQDVASGAAKSITPAVGPAQLRGRSAIIAAFGISGDRFKVLYESYQYALRKSGATARWNDDIEAYCRSIAALSEAEIELAKTDIERAILNRVITRLVSDARMGKLKR
jgi:hypothetical protein